MLHRVEVEVKVEVGHRRSTVSSSMANNPELCPNQMTLATPVSIRFANVMSVHLKYVYVRKGSTAQL